MEYTIVMSTNLLLFTFNCAKKLQSTTVIASAFNEALENVTTPDLFVVGLEEISPIMEASFNDLNKYIEPFENAMTLVSHNSYRIVSKKSIGAIVLLTFYKVGNIEVEEAKGASVRCGMYWSGLKGGVGTRLKVNKGGNLQEFTFVNAHLAANEGKAQLRNRDFQTIARGLDFGDGFGLYKPGCHTFFMGDLNYRATEGDPNSLLLNDELTEFLSADELNGQVKNNKVLFGFTEAPIKFKPTYKYLIGTKDKFKPNRTPSWCDRVFYLTYNNKETISAYNSIQDIVTSDHKPLYLGITVPDEYPGSVVDVDGTLKNIDGISIKYDDTYKTWDQVGSFVDNAIGWGFFLVNENKGRIVSLSLLVFLLFLIYR